MLNSNPLDKLFSEEIKPINDPKKLDDHMNTTNFVIALRILQKRVETLEQEVLKLKDGEAPAELTQRERKRFFYRTTILDIISDGRIWTGHAIAFEMQQKYPEFTKVSKVSIMNKCSKMANEGKFKRLAKGVYVKND